MKQGIKRINIRNYIGFIISGSGNGVFLSLFAPGGWLIQIMIAGAITAQQKTLSNVIVAYPAVIVLEMFFILLADFIGFRRLIILSMCARTLAIPLFVWVFYKSDSSPYILFFAYYLAFSAHIAVFQVAWPNYVHSVIPKNIRGAMIGYTRSVNIAVTYCLLAIVTFLDTDNGVYLKILIPSFMCILSFITLLGLLSQWQNNPVKNNSDIGLSFYEKVKEFFRNVLDLRASPKFRDVFFRACSFR